MRAFVFIAILFGATLFVVALKKSVAQDVAGVLSSDALSSASFFPSSSAAPDVEIADVSETPPGAVVYVAATNSFETPDLTPRNGLLSGEPIALAPLSTSAVSSGSVDSNGSNGSTFSIGGSNQSNAVGVALGSNAEKIDPYTSRSPSSWATTSIRASRNSLFQSVGAEISIAPGERFERGGVLESQIDATFGLPFFSLNTPLLISPTFAWTRFDLPSDLPRPFGDQLSLFSQGFAFQYYFPINEKLLLNANLNVFYNSDYHSNTSNAWFLSGYAAGAWKLNSKTNIMFGVYHNGAAKTWKTVPVGGVVWKPRDDFYFEALIPYPKVAKRVDWGVVDKDINVSPYWVYLSGDVAGNIWAFRTDSQTPLPDDEKWADRSAKASYFDYRLSVGIESKTGKEVDWAFEGGVAFARELTLETVDSGAQFSRTIKPKPAGIIRFRIEY